MNTAPGANHAHIPRLCDRLPLPGPMQSLGSPRGELWPLGKCRSSKRRNQSEHAVQLGIASAELSEAGGTASAARHHMHLRQACDCSRSLLIADQLAFFAPSSSWSTRHGTPHGEHRGCGKRSSFRGVPLVELPYQSSGDLQNTQRLSAQTQHSLLLTFLAKAGQRILQQQARRPVFGLDWPLSPIGSKTTPTPP